MVNLRFAESRRCRSTNRRLDELFPIQQGRHHARLAELGVMVLLGFIVLLFLVRPLVRRIVAPDGADAGAAGAAGVAAAGTSGVANGRVAACHRHRGVAQLAANHYPGGANISIVGSDESVAISNRTRR